jgi:hypothetical protein
MRRCSRRSLVVVSALGALAVTVGAQAESTAGEVALCHGTASAKNMYVLITVSENALQGHLDGSEPGHGWQNFPDMVYDDTYASCEAQYDAEDGGGPE